MMIRNEHFKVALQQYLNRHLFYHIHKTLRHVAIMSQIHPLDAPLPLL